MSIPLPLDYLLNAWSVAYGPPGNPYVVVGPRVPPGYIALVGESLSPDPAFLCDGASPGVRCTQFPPCVPAKQVVNSPIAIAASVQAFVDYMLFPGGVVKILDAGAALGAELHAFDHGAGFCYHLYRITRGPAPPTDPALAQLTGKLIAIPITRAVVPIPGAVPWGPVGPAGG